MRQSLAEAVGVIRKEAGDHFSGGMATAEMSRLPNGTEAAVVTVWYATESEVLFYTFPFLSDHFLGRGVASGAKLDAFEISLLNGAPVFADNSVGLSDGRLVSAVDILAAKIREYPTPLERAIVSSTIESLGAQESCYRSLKHGVPPQQQQFVPDHSFLDCSRLSGFSVPGLKRIQGYLADHNPAGRSPSQQTIANALQTFGMRIPTPRPRRHRHNSA